jgi:hypothetical protein
VLAPRRLERAAEVVEGCPRGLKNHTLLPINHPEFWKQELQRELGWVRKLLQRDGAEQLVLGSVTLERFVFVTAYIMRKLAEADAFTVEVTDSTWPVREFACIQPPPPASGSRCRTIAARLGARPLSSITT